MALGGVFAACTACCWRVRLVVAYLSRWALGQSLVEVRALSLVAREGEGVGAGENVSVVGACVGRGEGLKRLKGVPELII